MRYQPIYLLFTQSAQLITGPESPWRSRFADTATPSASNSRSPHHACPETLTADKHPVRPWDHRPPDNQVVIQSRPLHNPRRYLPGPLGRSLFAVVRTHQPCVRSMHGSSRARPTHLTTYRFNIATHPINPVVNNPARDAVGSPNLRRDPTESPCGPTRIRGVHPAYRQV